MEIKLKSKPRKEDLISVYDCGFKTSGSWSTRLKEHKNFCESKMGSYIMKLEQS